MPHVSPKNVEVWAVDKLKPYANNARKHSGEQVERIAKSIVAYGFNNPILVDSDQGILAGHGRLAAAKSLGLTEVPVIVLDHLSEKDRRAYILADNRLAELAQWDDSVLSQELEALGAGGVDLDALGWDVEELDDLAQELEEIVAEVVDEPVAGGDEVKKDSSYSEFLERYQNKATRALMVEYPLEDYARLVEILGELRERWALESNAEVLAKLINEAR